MNTNNTRAKIKNFKEKSQKRKMIIKRDLGVVVKDTISSIRKSSFIFKIALPSIGSVLIIYRLFFLDINNVQTKEQIDFTLVILGVILTIIQISDSRRLQEASFLVDLNKSFVENDTYTKVYDHLENNLNGIKNKSKLKSYEVSQYLTFFETLYILARDHAASIDDFDDLFGYRFFLAINDPDVWQLKLQYKNNFKNIYELEYRWFNYRTDRGIAILGKVYNIGDKSILQVKEESNTK